VRYCAFLRAINVGGHTVKMDHLRRLLEELGLSKVETFIASGNVIFEARGKEKTLEQKIERHLEKSLGYEVATFLRTPAEVAAAAAHDAFPGIDPDADGVSLYVGLLKSAPDDAAVKKLVALRGRTDAFHIHGREVYWLLHGPMSETKFSGGKIEKILGMPMTMRNVTTMRRLAAR